jgi:hypothetical protein
MVDISLLETSGDWQLSNGDLVLTSDAQSIGTNPILQDILQKIKFFQGEWFLDNSLGVPWFQQILVKNPDLAKIEAIFIDLILSVPGVDALVSFEFTPNLPNRSFTLSFQAQTTMGDIDYSGTIFNEGDST